MMETPPNENDPYLNQFKAGLDSAYDDEDRKFKEFMKEEEARSSRALTDGLIALQSARLGQYQEFSTKRLAQKTKTLQKQYDTSVARSQSNTEMKRRRTELQKLQQEPLEDRLAATAEVNSPTAASNQNSNTDTDTAVPFLKSAMKTPLPPYKPKSPIARMIDFVSGSSDKKKKRTSFGGVEVRIYTPSAEEVSDKNAAVRQNLGDGPTFPVVICDMPVYQQWRKYNGGQFVQHFDNCSKELAADKDIGLQTLHAARVMGLLRSLDQVKLRELALKVFPKYKRSFPCLTKHGACRMEAFLEYLNKRLDAHAAFVETKEEDPANPKWCFYEDRVSSTERYHHKDEYHHVKE